MESIRLEQLPELFASVADIMAEKADELCEMDARMGDGDLGLTMKKGFGALPEILTAIEEADMGKKLAKAGMKMSSVVPSTMGTLMSSGIMSGGKALTGAEAIDAAGYLSFLDGFCAGLEKRGKCQRGDRTVLDAVGAAADAVRAALQADSGLTLAAAAECALEGAKAGVESTRTMEPKFGKAAVHKAAAQGERDQGACAGMYMIEGYRNYMVR
ncbi:MAG: dihydroxyacetone kinase subunit L [Clostridia bacterium]|nr:dihydroxyacetone kinase subunit L [Clostridia bacterium]